MSELQVVIVTWNSAGTIGRCLETCSHLPVTVIDNASSDTTLEIVRRYPAVHRIVNAENRGFAAAVNQAITQSDAEYILLLNPDVELLTSITPLFDACASGAAIATGRLVDATGAAQIGFNVRRLPTALTLAFEALGFNRLFPWNPVNRRYRYLDLDPDSPAAVEQPAGAFLFFPRRLWLDLGGFDERFSPVWFEDVDFSKRALERGPIRYLPSVAARHQGGSSVASLDWRCRELYWYGSLLRYASKHFSPFKFRGVCGAVVLGSVLRSLTGFFSGRTLKAIKVYAGILGLAAWSMATGRVRDAIHVEAHQGAGSVRTITSSTK